MTAPDKIAGNQSNLRLEITEMENSLAQRFAAGTLSAGPRIYEHHARLVRQARARLAAMADGAAVMSVKPGFARDEFFV